jgi:hypothetical protein
MMLLQRYFEEVWDKGNLAAIDELTCPDAVIHSLLAGSGETAYDLASFKELFVPMRAGLRDVHVAVDVKLREGDMEAVWCVVTAMHCGDIAEDAGMERCKPIFFTGMTIARLREGRIVESWNCFDFETMYQQME